MMRLDKYLAATLGITRSESRKKIAGGSVAVNGILCKKSDTPVAEDDPTLTVTISGQPLPGAYRQFVYLMLNKPQGVVSASQDARDTTVVNLVQADYPRRRLFPAGRLDKTSTGFVLLTDDGTFAHDILAPGRHVPKSYLVTIDVPFTPAMAAAFSAGITLADGEKMAPAEAEPADDADPRKVLVTLYQGVYHQIKRMFGVCGAGVDGLHRLAIGGVALDAALAPGQYRELTALELKKIGEIPQKK